MAKSTDTMFDFIGALALNFVSVEDENELILHPPHMVIRLSRRGS